jgi:uncharacterized membrane protein HdeD (DUF308 family)
VPIAVQTLVLLYGAYAVVEGGLAVAAAMIGRRPGGFSWGMLLAGWASIVVGVITFLWPGRDECARRLRSRRIPAEDDRRPVSRQGRQHALVLLCLIAFWRALNLSAARPARTNGAAMVRRFSESVQSRACRPQRTRAP